MDENFINTVVSLHKKNNWEKILKFSDEYSKCNEITRKLLWVWPSWENLYFIQNIVNLNGSKGIISIGCGSGLFEWLLQQSTSKSRLNVSTNFVLVHFFSFLLEIPVKGFEVNKEWWTSKYCSPQFIPLEFPIMPPKSEYLNKDYALLFCYFNNGPAFADYINAYFGNLVFIIGPGKGRGTHTNPEPFKPNFQTPWKLYDFEEIRDTKDFIAAYVRVES